MILPVYLYGQPVLRKEAEEVPMDYPDLKQLVANMFETMYNADGVGLAAPQVGLSLRLLVIDADVMGDDFPECKGFKRAMTILNIKVSVKHISMHTFWKYRARKYLWKKAA